MSYTLSSLTASRNTAAAQLETAREAIASFTDPDSQKYLPERLADATNDYVACRVALDRWEHVLTLAAKFPAADLADVVGYAVEYATRDALRGADDTWSGRTGDARRSAHAGLLEWLDRFEGIGRSHLKRRSEALNASAALAV